MEQNALSDEIESALSNARRARRVRKAAENIELRANIAIAHLALREGWTTREFAARADVPPSTAWRLLKQAGRYKGSSLPAYNHPADLTAILEGL